MKTILNFDFSCYTIKKQAGVGNMFWLPVGGPEREAADRDWRPERHTAR
jgi:hypothetical protein